MSQRLSGGDAMIWMSPMPNLNPKPNPILNPFYEEEWTSSEKGRQWLHKESKFPTNTINAFSFYLNA